MTAHAGTVGPFERVASLAAALILLAASARGGRGFPRGLLATAGLALLPRAATGYCAVKAIRAGAPWGNSLRTQWDLARVTLGTPATQIDTLEALYLSELQELHSAEEQMLAVLEQLVVGLRHVVLERQLRGYATELRTRAQDLERRLRGFGADPLEHPDQAMQGLAREVLKMGRVSGANVREAALVASIQRLVHYKIAAYGSAAAYAKALSRPEEAGQLAGFAERERAVDGEFTALAKGTLNTEARLQPSGSPAASVRAH